MSDAVRGGVLKTREWWSDGVKRVVTSHRRFGERRHVGRQKSLAGGLHQTTSISGWREQTGSRRRRVSSVKGENSMTAGNVKDKVKSRKLKPET